VGRLSIPYPHAVYSFQDDLKINPQHLQSFEAERRRIDSELSNLVEFVVKGNPPLDCAKKSRSASGA